jgi:hypothetical protein
MSNTGELDRWVRAKGPDINKMNIGSYNEYEL